MIWFIKFIKFLVINFGPAINFPLNSAKIWFVIKNNSFFDGMFNCV